MCAWSKRRWGESKAERDGGLLFLIAGLAVVVAGLVGSTFGASWSPQVYEFLFAFRIIESIDAFMPYFPLVPFYPIFVIMLGAFLTVKWRG